MSDKTTASSMTSPDKTKPASWKTLLVRLGLALLGLALAGVLSIMLLVTIALAIAYPNLPDNSDLSITAQNCR